MRFALMFTIARWAVVLCLLLTIGLLWSACGSGELPVEREELYQAVSVGSAFICGLRLDGSVQCWGQDAAHEEEGMLGGAEGRDVRGRHIWVLR